LTIGIANICLSVQDYKQSDISHQGFERTNKEQRKYLFKT